MNISTSVYVYVYIQDVDVYERRILADTPSDPTVGNPLGHAVVATVDEGGVGGHDDSLRNSPYETTYIYVSSFFMHRAGYCTGTVASPEMCDLI